MADEHIDAVIVICTPTFAATPERVADVLPAAAGGGKPVVGCFLAAPELPSLLRGDDGGPAISAFASPEPAARGGPRARRLRPGGCPFGRGAVPAQLA